MMQNKFSPDERKRLLDQIFNLMTQYETEGEKPDRSEPEKREMEVKMTALCEAYLSGIERIPISRCPFTGTILEMPLDTGGLDGLWWNSDAPMRPAFSAPETLLGFDGALTLKEEPEKAPFIAAPGPDVPFVLPGLLRQKQVKAVISSVKIGHHTGYVILYFSDPPQYDMETVNDWGANGFWMKRAQGQAGTWRQAVTSEKDRDFNLEPWIRHGKLLWINPDDKDMRLHSHISQCPYLALNGDKRRQFILNGTIWRMEENSGEPADFDAERFLKLAAELEGGKE